AHRHSAHRADLRWREDGDALSSRHDCTANRPDPSHRSDERPHPWRCRRNEVMATDVCARVGAGRLVARSGADALVLHADRGFDPDPGVRRIARDLYDETRGLPIVSPHGHVDPQCLALNTPFVDPAALIVTPDHYIVRMLYSQGAAMDALGIPHRDDSPVESDPRKVWQLFAAHY